MAPERGAPASEDVKIRAMNCDTVGGRSSVHQSGDPGMLPQNKIRHLGIRRRGKRASALPTRRSKLGGTNYPQYRLWVEYNRKR